MTIRMLSADDKLAEIKRLYYETTRPTIQQDLAKALDLLKSMSSELKEKIAADFRAVAADGSIAERLKATGQAINLGGPKEFADSINEQRSNVASVAKAIDFKPRN